MLRALAIAAVLCALITIVLASVFTLSGAIDPVQAAPRGCGSVTCPMDVKPPVG